MMTFSSAIVGIFDNNFLSNLTFPLTTLRIQSQKDLIMSSGHFKMKHLFNTIGKSLYKSTV